VDRKNHFPVPSNVRQRRPELATTTAGKTSAESVTKPSPTHVRTGSSSRATPALLARRSSSTEIEEGRSSGAEVRPGTAASSGKGTTVDKGKRRSVGDAVTEGIGTTKEKVISPELRDLLRKDVYYALEKGEVKQHGGGV